MLNYLRETCPTRFGFFVKFACAQISAAAGNTCEVSILTLRFLIHLITPLGFGKEKRESLIYKSLPLLFFFST